MKEFLIILIAFFICSFEAKAYEWFNPDNSVFVDDDEVTFVIYNISPRTIICDGYITVITDNNEYKHKTVKYTILPNDGKIDSVMTFANRKLVNGKVNLRCRY